MPRKALPKKKVTKREEQSVYSEEEEENLHFDEETNKPLCEVCGELLSSSVENDYPIKCKTCKFKKKVHKACILFTGKDKDYKCDLCKAKLKKIPKCEFCPIRTLRAMKQNGKDKSKWAHLACVTFTPGVCMDDNNTTYTSNASEILSRRICAYCKTNQGSIVYCCHPSCRKGFHPLCGRLHNCVLGWDEEKDRTNLLCDKHSEQTYQSAYCEVCEKPSDEDHLLLCDGCDKGYHTYCLKPPLKAIPAGDWYCAACLKERVTKGDAVVVQKGSKAEHIDISTAYVAKLAEQQKRAKSSSLPPVDDEDEDDEGVSFYETKRVRRSKKGKAEGEADSDAALELEEVSKMSHSEINAMLLNQPVKHIERGKVQRFTLQRTFGQWKAELLSGFNLLLTGFGSKYNLLTEFITHALESEKVMLTEFLQVLLSNGLHVHTDGMRQEVLMQEALKHAQGLHFHLFIVVHSLDGVGLANKGILEFFAQLSSAPKVHFIASIDHIRGSLMFTPSLLNQFHFAIHNATTFEPYFYEKLHLSHINQTIGAKTSSGLHYVLSSLTSNHLKILQTLSRETTAKEGITFSNLYELCLSEMLVSSEKSLQLIIKELEDHELIKKVVNASSPQESYVCLVNSKELKSFCEHNT